MTLQWADPTGHLITVTRAALVNVPVRGYDPDDIDHDVSPMVLIRNYGDTSVHLGANSRQTGYYTARFAINCFAPISRTGRQDARVLALRVAAALDGISVGASGNRPALMRILVESIGATLIDPDTREPYVNVIVALYVPTKAGA